MYFGFDLTSLSGKCITSATLRLVKSSSYPSPVSSSNLIYITRTANTWVESTFCWNKRSSVDDLDFSSAQFFVKDTSGSTTYYTLIVPNDFLQDTLLESDKGLSIAVSLDNGGSSNFETAFYTKDYSTSSYRPKLVVESNTCGTNAICLNGACVCPEGYVFDSNQNCIGERDFIHFIALIFFN